MYVIIILVIIAGRPHPPSQWNERYATYADCRNAIPEVAVQFEPEEGVTIAFNCIMEERGA
jgi:hypothetical protein